jgi:hypothetical protein
LVNYEALFTISGPKVHDVGYRYFLMNKAMASRIKMFEAHNIEYKQEQQVMVLVDGGEKDISGRWAEGIACPQEFR